MYRCCTEHLLARSIKYLLANTGPTYFCCTSLLPAVTGFLDDFVFIKRLERALCLQRESRLIQQPRREVCSSPCPAGSQFSRLDHYRVRKLWDGDNLVKLAVCVQRQEGLRPVSSETLEQSSLKAMWFVRVAGHNLTKNLMQPCKWTLLGKCQGGRR